MADKVGLVLPPSRPSPRGRLSCFAPNPHFSFFLHLLQSPPQAGGDVRPKGANPPKEGDGRQSLPFFTPFQTFPFGGLSRFAPRWQWSSVSAEFSSPSRIPSVVEWLFRRILAMGFLDGIVSPATFHNGSNFRISLPLRNGFSAASLLWASWTALSLRPPSTTAAISAFPCRCGMAFPPHPCYGLPGRHCLPSPLPQRQHFPRFSAVVELLFRRILAWASWTALSPRAPSTTALITAFSCRCGKDRRAHLPKVIRILPDLARLRKVG